MLHRNIIRWPLKKLFNIATQNCTNRCVLSPQVPTSDIQIEIKKQNGRHTFLSMSLQGYASKNDPFFNSRPLRRKNFFRFNAGRRFYGTFAIILHLSRVSLYSMLVVIQRRISMSLQGYAYLYIALVELARDHIIDRTRINCYYNDRFDITMFNKK